VFVSFVNSQAGMIRHWNRNLPLTTDPARRRQMKRSRVINTIGLAVTSLVLAIILISKFTEGAWIAIVAMIVLFILMRTIRHHYDLVREELVPDDEDDVLPSRVHAVVLVSRVHKATLRAITSRLDAVDGTAAGDAFCAALLVYLLRGVDREEALRLACAAGALTASRLGAQPSLPTMHDVEELARRHGVSWKGKFSGQLAEVRLDGHRVGLLKPETFMNESGRSVGAAARFFKLEPDAILVVHDELDLELGRLQARSGRGLAGHNGLRSIAAHLKTSDFLRLRVGVGRPGRGDPRKPADYVLSNFTAEEDPDALVARAADAVEKLDA